MRKLLSFARERAARAGMTLAARAEELLAGSASGRPAAQFAPQKLAAIRSYAEFCDGGGFPAYPLEMFLEVSNICDLKCAMCVEFSALNPHRLDMIKAKQRGFMEIDETSGHLHGALQHALLVHCFGYGEPTIHPQFRELIDLVVRYEVLVDFFTNGMHLDEDFCRFLVDRKVYKITVSFSGATKEIYENIYLGGDFDKVLGGLERLAEIKHERGTRYPIIEINSLGFNDHVAQFEAFVELMAARGVDVIFLKRLQHHKIIPQLYEHVSVMRQEKEGAVVKRAVALGRRLGVDVRTSLYEEAGASDEADYQRRIDWLREAAARSSAPGARAFGQNPIGSFRDLAKEVPLARSPEKTRKPHDALSPDVDAFVARSLLRVDRPPGSASDQADFYCMEPFKTLYLTRNGAAKPCCFANPHAWYLGDTQTADALDVWRGTGFQTVRSAVAGGEYPLATCEVCLRNKSGPQGHFANHLLESYFTWHRRNFGAGLREQLMTIAPEALPLVVNSTSSEVMERRRRAGSSPTPNVRRIEPDVGGFVSGADCFVSAPLDPEQVELPAEVSSHPGLTADDERKFLLACARDDYRGDGAILDIGSYLGASAAALATGLRAHVRAEEIVARFAGRRTKPIRGYERGDIGPRGLVVRPKDRPPQLRAPGTFAPELTDLLRAHADLIETIIGDFADLRWPANQPVEICFFDVQGQRKLIRRGVETLFRCLMPGRSLIVHGDYYTDRTPATKVLMGYLDGFVEWLGQVGTLAAYRLVKPIPPEMLALDPYDAMPLDACVEFHRRSEHPGLPRERQFKLDLSLADLLSDKSGIANGLAHLDGMSPRYVDLLDDDPRRARICAGLIERTRERLSRRAKAAV